MKISIVSFLSVTISLFIKTLSLLITFPDYIITAFIEDLKTHIELINYETKNIISF